MNKQKVPRTVWILGIVSFFNDLASEMVYPIVPIFLATVLHTSIPIIGLIEGFAEGIASIGKFVFGAYSDVVKKRKIFVTVGYSLGAISKLLIGLATGWPFVLLARFVDRTGKGIRTAPRDSLLLENTTAENKGYIFGIHRAMDSMGAVFGPLVALLLMYLLHENLRMTFFIAAIPGIIAVFLLIFFVKEKRNTGVVPKRTQILVHLKMLPPRLKIFLGISVLFSLGNSSDSFLLLNAKNIGLSTTLVVLVYVLYNVAQALFSAPAGYLSDKFGARKIFTAGLFIFSFVYFGFGLFKNPVALWILFPVYGMYIAATDGVSKAYISEFISKEESGTFFGAYYSLNAIATFLASAIGGILWSTLGPSWTFYYGSAMAMAAGLVLLGTRKKFI